MNETCLLMLLEFIYVTTYYGAFLTFGYFTFRWFLCFSFVNTYFSLDLRSGNRWNKNFQIDHLNEGWSGIVTER